MRLYLSWYRNIFRASDSNSPSTLSDCTAVRNSLRSFLKLWLPFAILFLSCSEAPDLTEEPQIEFINISQTVLSQGTTGEDSTQVTIGFSDGDGNLGEDQESNLFFVDLRDSFETGFSIPFIPEEGAGNGITGEINVNLQTTCCIFPNGQQPCTPSDAFPTDTVIYEVYIIDRDQNESNRIELPPITLLCD